MIEQQGGRLGGQDVELGLHNPTQASGDRKPVGRVAEVADELEALLADQVRVLGPDHPDALATRGSVAYCLGESGRAAEATDQLEVLLADQIRVLGLDHPDTLLTRHVLVGYLGNT